MLRTREAGRSFFTVAVRPQTLWLLFLFLVAAGASAQTRSTIPAVESIIARMTQARTDNQARFRSYIVTRDYKLFGKERQKTKSQVIADVTFVPPDFKKYAIQQTNGTGLGERIVRRMLASEAEITKDYASTDFSPSNYDFRIIREEEVSGQRCYVLELLPTQVAAERFLGLPCVTISAHPRHIQESIFLFHPKPLAEWGLSKSAAA